MPQPLRLLLVEDNPVDAELLMLTLRQGGFAPEWERVDTEEAYLARLHPDLDLVISDYQMPQFSGLRALELMKAKGLEVPFILASGTIGEETAVEAMKMGASDYLLKDRLVRLGPAVTKAMEQNRLRREQVAAEQARGRAEAKYRTIFENSVEGLYQTTADGRMLIANPALARIAGYDSPEEMIADVRNVGEQFYVNLADRARFQHAMQEAGLVRGFEAQMRRRNGELIWISSDARVLRDDAGAVCYEGALRDITVRKQTEEALRSSERRFRTTLENLMEGCQIIGRDWRYLYVNAIAARHGRRTVEEQQGRTMAEVFPGIEVTPVFGMLRRCMEDGLARQMEHEYAYDDGSTAWVQLVIQPVPEGLFVLSLDITARKRADEKIQGQLTELQRWHDLTLGREERVIALKQEVNELLAAAGAAPRYGVGAA